jgi:hypothetical protein
MVKSDAEKLERFWSNPDLMDESDLEWIEELAQELPAAVPIWWLYLRLVQKLNLPEFPKILGRTAAISPNRQALMNWVETPLMPVEQAQNDVGPILRAEPAHIEVDEPHVELIEAIEEEENVVLTGTPNEFESVSLEPEVLDQQPIEVEEKKDDQVRPTAIELLPKHIQEKIL